MGKWFCILTKCTVTFLYLLRAPPPPTGFLGKSTLLLAEEAAKRLPWQPFCFQQLLFWFEGLAEGRRKEKTWGELGGFLMGVQIKRVTVICGHCLK